MGFHPLADGERKRERERERDKRVYVILSQIESE